MDKLNELEKILKNLKKVAIAFSGGIDSSFLLFYANKVLGKENVLAIIANGQMLDKEDFKSAIEFLKENNFNYKEITFNPLEIEAFRENRENRCYYCKKSLMSKIKEVALNNGFENILNGKNTDDSKVYRPGNKALEELEIISPLEESDFSKNDIREHSKKMGIKFWNKPSNSCLATRFPYNTQLSEELLKKVEISENLLKTLGIPKVRVRIHGNIAKIEVEEKYFEKIIHNKNIINEIKNIGFDYITLDLNGLKSGTFDKK